MPYTSKAQRAFMHIHHPEIAAKWDKEFPNQGRLPQHKNPVKKALKIEHKIHKQMGIHCKMCKGESLSVDKAQFKYPQHRTIARGML